MAVYTTNRYQDVTVDFQPATLDLINRAAAVLFAQRGPFTSRREAWRDAMKKEPIDDLRLLFLRLIAEETLLKARKAELLNLLADENIEMRDSALVLDADARELIAELHGVDCRFMTVEGQPRFYYPADTEAGLVQRVASLVGGRDALSKMFRRLAREEAA